MSVLVSVIVWAFVASSQGFHAYLGVHRWVASNITMSGMEHEMQTAFDLIAAAVRRLALLP